MGPGSRPRAPHLDVPQVEEAETATHRGRFDPRAVSLVAAMALRRAAGEHAVAGAAGVAAFLAIAWAVVAAGHLGAARPGCVFAAVLGGGALLFGLGGGLGLDETLRRALRAALLVLVATWLRAAAGAEGLREVGRRMLAKARRVPSMPEAAVVLDSLGSSAGSWPAPARWRCRCATCPTGRCPSSTPCSPGW